jgi:hypothetical protein
MIAHMGVIYGGLDLLNYIIQSMNNGNSPTDKFCRSIPSIIKFGVNLDDNPGTCA